MQRIHLLVTCSFLLTVGATAQAPATQKLVHWLSEPAGALPDSAPAAMRFIDRADLARHTFVFASDAFGGRHTGTPGQARTADYITRQFVGLGLEPLGDGDGSDRSFLQSYPVARTFLDPKTLGLTVAGTTHREGFGVMPGREESSIDITGRFVFCGRGRRADMPEAFAEGDIPVVVVPPPKATKRKLGSEMQFMMGFREIGRAGGAATRASRAGAKTCVFLDLGNRLVDVMQYGGVLPGKPDLKYGDEVGMSSMLQNARVPFVVVGKPLAMEILEVLNVTVDEDGVPTQSEAPTDAAAACRIDVRHEGEYPCTNVVACIRGSDPVLRDEAIVFSAHMDHMGTRLDGDVFNGADDNASGSAALLEVAEAFARGERPRRTIIFLSVSGEELGLWGSDWFAKNPTWPRDKIVANVNIDMIGRATELSGSDAISATPSPSHSMFSTIVQRAAGFAAAFGMELTNGDKFYERSDHYNFAKHGIPVVFFCDGEHPDYHQVTDTADKLDYRKVENVARLAYWTGLTVANADGKPETLGRRSGWRAEDGGGDGGGVDGER